jgi:hypothetical protein
MLKGIQKNMIWVRTPESRCFEAACFVLRPRRSGKEREGEMLREAERLIAEGNGRRSEKRGGSRWLFFFLGAAAGATVPLGLWALLCL